MAAPPPGLPPPSSIDDLLTIYDLKIDTKSSQVSLSSPAPADSAVAADLAATLATINELAPLLARGPFPHCPPPPPPPPFINPQTANIPNPRAAQVAKVRTDGNNAFNKGDFGRAVDLYSLAAEMAATRPLFEHSAWVKEELSVVLCNRCAAYQSMKKYTEALADAETVISLKNNWSKGHFRKAKTLQAMQRWDAALDATLLGLEFEPTNKDLSTLADQLRESRRAKPAAAAVPPAATTTTAAAATPNGSSAPTASSSTTYAPSVAVSPPADAAGPQAPAAAAPAPAPAAEAAAKEDSPAPTLSANGSPTQSRSTTPNPSPAKPGAAGKTPGSNKKGKGKA